MRFVLAGVCLYRSEETGQNGSSTTLQRRRSLSRGSPFFGGRAHVLQATGFRLCSFSYRELRAAISRRLPYRHDDDAIDLRDYDDVRLESEHCRDDMSGLVDPRDYHVSSILERGGDRGTQSDISFFEECRYSGSSSAHHGLCRWWLGDRARVPHQACLLQSTGTHSAPLFVGHSGYRPSTWAATCLDSAVE
jgi:hypothetical protein